MKEIWYRQVQGILRMEIRKNLFSLRALPIHGLAAFPVLVTFLLVVASTLTGPPDELSTFAGASVWFAVQFQIVLRFMIYFACVWVFMNLFRGDVLDRSLHYYFLAPVRREVLVAGKFLSAWSGATLLFFCSTIVSFVVIYSFPAGESLFTGAALGHLVAYLAITALACLGYGAVFLVVGLFLRNPVVPALAFFIWEGANPLLPGLLKKFSVVFYLQTLLPVHVGEGPFAFIVTPVSAWIGVPGLILFTALVLTLAGFRIRQMEIAYSSD